MRMRCTYEMRDGTKPGGTGFGFKQNKVTEQKMEIRACRLGRNYTKLKSTKLRAITF